MAHAGSNADPRERIRRLREELASRRVAPRAAAAAAKVG
jgi:hypothetical protein